MAIIELRRVSVGFGGPSILEGVDLQVERGERLCLIGLNGTGKSTLMKLINGKITPDDGLIQYQQGLKIARLSQEAPEDMGGEVFDVVAGGLADVGPLLAEYHHVSHRLALEETNALLRELERIQHRLEAVGGWRLNQRVTTVLSRLELDPDVEFATLSGGLKRRVLLAQVLVREPDLLLLDEPTNHLDIKSIRWLEEFLLGYEGTLLFVTHDRMFIRALATRIVELDRGRLGSWPGDYDTYLRRRDAALEAEEKQEALFDKKLALEETWIRQGIKARRTRNEGRVRALLKMRDTRKARRAHAGTARLRLQGAERSGKLVMEASGVDYSYGNHTYIRDFSTTILRGDKVGILGPNGCGKTTLLNILLGKLSPKKGKVRLGTRLEMAYFDQHRAQLEEDRTVIDNVAGGSEKISIDGKSRHVISYLQDFLFPPSRARTPVSALSGGERNRLLLARLFTRPANVLVMDEPTNDLDAETLELLEELLLEYPGTLLLVSHDRAFLNNVVTSTLAFEGDGRIGDYVGGYDDWLRQRRRGKPHPPVKAAKGPPPDHKQKSSPTRKLSYGDQRELEELPRRIEALEAEQETLRATLADPAFYQRGGKDIAVARERLATLERELEDAYERWEALEALK